MNRALSVLLLGTLLFLSTGTAVLAQGTAEISGTVRDQSGAVLPGVQFSATQIQTGFVRNAVTNETGLYILPNLPIGPPIYIFLALSVVKHAANESDCGRIGNVFAEREGDTGTTEQIRGPGHDE